MRLDSEPEQLTTKEPGKQFYLEDKVTASFPLDTLCPDAQMEPLNLTKNPVYRNQGACAIKRNHALPKEDLAPANSMGGFFQYR